MLRRLFDIGLAFLGIALTFPVFAIVGFLIFFLDGNPVVFRHMRVGKCGRDFTLYKFRTMSVCPEAEQGAFDPGNQCRVTRIGAFLRRTKLDEIPQLWNVLKGDMSFVGPRPEVRKCVELYPQRWALIHTVKPGITDPASILYCNEENLLAQVEDPKTYYREQILPHKLDLYEQYIRTCHFSTDIKLIIRTVFSSILPRNVQVLNHRP